MMCCSSVFFLSLACYNDSPNHRFACWKTPFPLWTARPGTSAPGRDAGPAIFHPSCPVSVPVAPGEGAAFAIRRR